MKNANAIKLRMDNLPGNPWFTYHKLKRYGNSTLWSSLPKRSMQYQAEQFWMTDDEVKYLKADGRIQAVRS